jgi:hypothetical protein
MIVIVAITLSVKEDNAKFKQLLFTLFIAQLFNLDLLSVETCGTMATISSITLNSISFKFIPKIIETKQASLINLPISALSSLTAFIWLIFAVLTHDLYFGVSQGLSFVFNLVMVLFYMWATDDIDETTPVLNGIMRILISIFLVFTSKKKLVDTELIKIQHTAEAIL